MAAEQTTGILANASAVTKEVPAATNALREFAGAAEVANLALTVLRREPRIELAVKATRYVGEGAVDGMREEAAYSRARTSSGNYAGVTNDQLRRMEVEIAGTTGGSRAKAAEALSSLVASGQVQGQVLQQAATAVVQMNRVSGVSIKDAVENFSKLADEPVKASAELNKRRNYLTPDVAKRMSDLEGQGQKEAAAAVAQKAFAVAVDQRARQQIDDMTFFDSWLLRLREFSDRPKDIVRNVGRGTTLQEDYDRASTKRDNRLRRDGGAGTPMAETQGGAAVGYPLRPTASIWNRDSEKLRELQAQQARSAASQGESASRAKAAVSAELDAKDALESDKKSDEIARKVVALQGGKASPPSASSAGASTTKASMSRSASAGIQHAEGAGLRPCIEVVCGCKAGAPDQAKQGVRKGEASEVARPQATASEAAERASVDPEQARQAALLESMRKATSGVLEQTTALDAQNTAHGKTKSALKELNIAQLERQYQDLDNTEQVIPGYLEALGARIDAEKELLKVTRSSEGIETADKEKTKREAKASKMSDDIGGAFREGFVNLLEGKENALDKMGESLKKKIVSSVADALYDASLKPAVEAFSGWFSGLFKGSSAGAGTAAGASSGGSWIGSAVSTVLGFFGVKSANGNVFSSPGLHAYANSVVGQPTFFPFANGIGLMGEAGPEAIMPLRRGSDGRLGVSAPGGASAAPAIQFAPSNVFHIDARSDRGAVMADMQRLLAENNRGQMEQLKRVKVLPQ
ncbi:MULTISPECIES: phage tail length tape measure family protein [Variovorax]|mgnify:CR=1 FL=1|uniref:phage tail length tape measure family protein n=1 Tax=Variovorax TaxID=34072 RepID=UPI000A50A163|nr:MULTISPECIES: phage tail length tape measure family protein [Variovorax]MBN8755186.1 phage tail tape measure protein [Variovorax sp.]UKI08787.1 phage tail length tape measure family protein [Variovorax paradoxus]